jgi:hypothetical protein
MSYMASGTLGAVAAVLALGAVHLEVSAGNDVVGPVLRGDASVITPARAADNEKIAKKVDRSAKGDRDTRVTPGGGITLSFKLPSLPDTSVLMRVPAGEAADALRKAPSTTGTNKGSSAGSRPVACEPVVSVLTAVAKQLEPGRCVT